MRRTSMSLLAIAKKTSTYNALLFSALMPVSTITTANEVTSSKSTSYSINEKANEITSKDVLKNNKTVTSTILQKEGFRTESGPVTPALMSTSYDHYGNYSIYDVETSLVNDFDHDGFYHYFSVSIDADTIFSTAYVYAKLYLSYEGGPWNYYASSDAFHIYGDSPHDAFIVETELAEGFPPGIYDIRVELYDADFNEWILSYGPYEDYSLSALPLEDTHYDKAPVEVIHSIETEVLVTGHGSMSFWLIPAIGLLVALRRYSKNR